MIQLAYTLSMPSRSSWNGRWSGDERLHVVVRKYRDAGKLGPRIRDGQSYGYNFGDGWFARVEVRRVDGKEAQRLRRKSAGFCGYDWMIDSIETNGDIRTGGDR